jgi:hypothetical protein
MVALFGTYNETLSEYPFFVIYGRHLRNPNPGQSCKACHVKFGFVGPCRGFSGAECHKLSSANSAERALWAPRSGADHDIFVMLKASQAAIV